MDDSVIWKNSQRKYQVLRKATAEATFCSCMSPFLEFLLDGVLCLFKSKPSLKRRPVSPSVCLCSSPLESWVQHLLVVGSLCPKPPQSSGSRTGCELTARISILLVGQRRLSLVGKYSLSHRLFNTNALIVLVQTFDMVWFCVYLLALTRYWWDLGQ